MKRIIFGGIGFEIGIYIVGFRKGNKCDELLKWVCTKDLNKF